MVVPNSARIHYILDRRVRGQVPPNINSPAYGRSTPVTLRQRSRYAVAIGLIDDGLADE